MATATQTGVSINRASLLSALAKIRRVVPRSTPKPILLSIKLTADSSGCSVLATDLTQCLRLSIAGASGELDCVLLPAPLTAFCQAAGGGEVEITPTKSGVRITCGRSEMSLPTENPQEYPTPPAVDAEPITVPQRLLATAINRTAFCIKQDDGRFAIGSLCLEVAGGAMRTIGTDGRACASHSVVDGIKSPDAVALVPVESAKTIAALLGDDSECRLRIGSSMLAVQGDGFDYATRLSEGRFPKAEACLPQVLSESFVVSAGALTTAARVALAIDKGDAQLPPRIHLKAESGLLTLRASMPQSADESRTELPIVFEGNLSVSVNAKYVTGFLATRDPEDDVHLGIVSNERLYLYADEQRYVICALIAD